MRMPYLFLCLFLFQAINIFAQAPEKINYQATIRNADNTVLSEARTGLKVAILQRSFTGEVVYEEVHSPITSANGMVSIEIGGGTPLKGVFSEINWADGPYFIETSVDVNGGTTYEIQATSQLMSVPYALHANTADRLANSAGFVEKSKVHELTASRSISSDDIGNIVACTADASLKLTANFSAMRIGDIIYLEAHNGAKLSILAVNGVRINYTEQGLAEFKSKKANVSFGLLRKTGDNDYIISGQ